MQYMSVKKHKHSAHRLNPNIFMGQHFLTAPAVLRNIIAAAKLTKKDTVIEIGPGKGILTEALMGRVKKVIAIEKDKRLVAYLKDAFKNEKNVDIIEGDILEIASHPHSVIHPALQETYKIVANLPYYITSRFLRVFLSPKTFAPPISMTLLVQKEVAERIVLRHRGKEKMSLLGLSVGAYGSPNIIASVKPSAFKPAPKVHSAILSIEHISDAFFKKHRIDPQIFFFIAKQAFSKKRKMLKSSLGIKNPAYCKKRPEELSLDEWAILTREILHNEQKTNNTPDFS